MTRRFTIDHGSASICASLIAVVGGRWRLLAAAAVPAGADVEALLAHLVGQVVRADARLGGELLGGEGPDGWRRWERLEVRTLPARRIAIVAPTERRLALLEDAVARSGWTIMARVAPDRTDALEATALLGDRRLDAVALGAGEPLAADERAVLPDLAALVAAVAGRREGLRCILAGGASDEVTRFPADRVVLGPAPETAADSAEQLAALLVAIGGDEAGSRAAFGRGVGSLAEVLDRRVEAVEVGHTGGAWYRAEPPRLDGFALAEAALVPHGAPEDDAPLDAILAWSPSRADRATQRDRLRDLRIAPWREAAGEGAVLRMTAVRAALARLEAARRRFSGVAAASLSAPDLLVASGGAFAVAPAPVVALALADTIRRPGMTQLALDHARLLAPLGSVEDEGERRRLLFDLADDLLAPLGSVLVVQGVRPGRDPGRLRVTSEGASAEQPLTPGTVGLVDLPPGAPAVVELALREGASAGARGRRIAFETVGGLGGLLLDTRDVPLRLPERAERRREQLEAWQRAFWQEGEA
ncbi:MAG: hypothetical protein A2X23_08740 [Chloroflexi bacterium GWC2_73_18]|nr:MAG: hypothetical protein A2X23_08740 [Chloroflexi bacterium GWC2_73_18]